MKNKIVPLLSIAVMIAFASFTYQQDKKRLATVKVIDSVEIYIMCNPIRNFEIVGDINSAGNTFSTLTIEKWMTAYVNKAKKKDTEFDALIFQNNWSATMVKWRD